jgi:hypothetical protein
MSSACRIFPTVELQSPPAALDEDGPCDWSRHHELIEKNVLESDLGTVSRTRPGLTLASLQCIRNKARRKRVSVIDPKFGDNGWPPCLIFRKTARRSRAHGYLSQRSSWDAHQQ